MTVTSLASDEKQSPISVGDTADGAESNLDLTNFDFPAASDGQALRRQGVPELPHSSIGSALLSLARLLTYLLLTAISVPVQLVSMRLFKPFSVRFPMIYHRFCAKIMGFRVHVVGAADQTKDQSVLFVSNHSSYLDIPLLGATVPGSFVAKSEVASWPLFGFLSKLQRTVYVDRRVRSTATQRDALQQRLDAQENLILFPEGTSNDGNRVYPFKSALFSVAALRPNDKPLIIQPVSISYVRLNGIPLGYRCRPYFAWYGDMEMGDHLWTVVGLGICDVIVEFHEPVTLDMFDNRKELAKYCHTKVSEGVSRALTGRIPLK